MKETKSINVHGETHALLRKIAKSLQVPVTVLLDAMTAKAAESRNMRILLRGYLHD